MDHREPPQPAPRTFIRSQLGATRNMPVVTEHTNDYKRCRLCAGHHALRTCAVFLGLQPQQRFLLARAHKYCTNCLALSHPTAQCTSTTTCHVCSLQHHTLLHRSSMAAVRRTHPYDPAQATKHRGRASQRGKVTSAATNATAVRQHATKTATENRTVQCTARGLQTATYRGKVTRILVHEAMRALQELKEALAA